MNFWSIAPSLLTEEVLFTALAYEPTGRDMVIFNTRQMYNRYKQTLVEEARNRGFDVEDVADVAPEGTILTTKGQIYLEWGRLQRLKGKSNIRRISADQVPINPVFEMTHHMIPFSTNPLERADKAVDVKDVLRQSRFERGRLGE